MNRGPCCQVYYSGLEDHPDHDIHMAQASGAGSVVCFRTGSLPFSQHIVTVRSLWYQDVASCSTAKNELGVSLGSREPGAKRGRPGIFLFASIRVRHANTRSMCSVHEFPVHDVSAREPPPADTTVRVCPTKQKQTVLFLKPTLRLFFPLCIKIMCLEYYKVFNTVPTVQELVLACCFG